MKRFLLFAVAAALLVGCEGAPLPTESPDLKKGKLPAQAAAQAQINNLINALFNQPEKREAHKLFAQVKRGMASGDEDYAREQMAELVNLATTGLNDGNLNDPDGETAEVAVARLIDLLFAFVGLDLPEIDPEIFESEEYVVQVVPPTGGTVLTEHAGVEISDEAVDWWQIVTIRRINQDPCLPTGLHQSVGCWEYTKSDARPFIELVEVGLCVDVGNLVEQYPDVSEEYPDGYGEYLASLVRLHKYNPEEGVTKLAEEDGDIGVVCTDFEIPDVIGDAGLIRSLGDRLMELLGPRPLHAALAVGRPKRLGGMTGSFTDMGGAVEADVEIEDGDGQTGGVGSPVPVDPTVHVTDATGADLEGVEIWWYPQNGTVSDVTTLTDSEGLTSVSWTLSSAEGENSLIATTKAEGDSVTFTANGVTIPAGLVSWWPADGYYSDIVSGNHGSAHPTTVDFATGIIGDAFQFTGAPNEIGFSGTNLGALQQLTVAAWVNLDEEGPAGDVQRFVTLFHEKAVLRQDGSSEDGDRMLHFYMNFSSASLPFNQWDLQGIWYEGLEAGCFNHVAGTYDGSAMRLYLNGVLVGMNTVTGTVNDDGDGGHFSNPPEPLDGLLDEVQVYEHALGDVAIQDMYDAGGAGACAPPSLTIQFIQQPTTTMAGGTISPPVVVQVNAGGEPLPGAQVSIGNGAGTPAGCGVLNLPQGAVTDGNGRATFANLLVGGSCAPTLTATATFVGFAPVTVESEPYEIAIIGGVVGTATVDGVIGEGEWDGTRCASFSASTPSSGPTPATVCVMNDATTFYGLITFERTSDPQSLAAIEFDLDGDGVLGIDPGDDLILVQQASASGFFRDEVVYDGGSCPSVCTTSDDTRGGTVDGAGAFSNDEVQSVYEFSHPLNSEDEDDIAVASGDVIQIQIITSIRDAVDGAFAVTRHPTGTAGFRMLIF